MGRGLAVVCVEVPATPSRFASIHEDPQSTARVAVEVLHQQTPTPPGPDPALEIRKRCGEAARRKHVDDAQLLNEPQRSPRRRVTDAELLVDASQGLGVGVSLDVGAPVPQVCGAVSHRRENEVRLGPMEPATGEDPTGLDDQHGLTVRVDEVRTELITELPPDRHEPQSTA